MPHFHLRGQHMLHKNASKKLRLSTETLATLNSKEPQVAVGAKTKHCPSVGCTYGCTTTFICYYFDLRWADETLALEVEQDLLRCLGRTQMRGVEDDFGIRGRLVRIRDSSEFLHDAGARLGVESFAVASLADRERRRDVDEHVPALRLDHRPHFLSHGVVRSDGGADCHATVLRDLGGDEPDAPDVDVAVLLRKSELGGEVLPHDVAIEQRHVSAAHLEQLHEEDVGDGRFA